MKKHKVFGITILLIVLLLICMAFAYPVFAKTLSKRPPFLPGARAFLFVLRLDLTERQEAGMAAILAEEREELKILSRHFNQASLELFQLVHSPDFDEFSVRDAHKEVAAAGEELAVARARAAAKIMLLLDSRQHQLIAAALDSFSASTARKTDRFWRQLDTWIQERDQTGYNSAKQ